MGRGRGGCSVTEQIHLDTHVVIWLAAGDTGRFPQPLLSRMESADLVVSPIVRLELDLLHERGKIRSPASDLIDKVTVEVGVREDPTPLANPDGHSHSEEDVAQR